MNGVAAKWLLERRDTWLLAGILGLAAVLRAPGLTRTSLWHDEAVSWVQSKGTLAELLASVAADNYPPLHNLVLWLTMPLIGDSEWALRLPSLLAGLLSVWLVFVLGRLVFGRTAGLLAAFLLAISPFHVWYSNEARMYALFAATGLAFLIFLARSMTTGARSAVIGTALFGALFLYSHVYAAFSFAAVGAVLVASLARLRSRPQTRDIVRNNLAALAALVAAGLLFLPWVGFLAQRVNRVVTDGFWVPYPDAAFLATLARDMAGSEALFLILLVLLAGGSLALRQARTVPDGDPGRTVFVVALAAFTVGAPVIGYLLSVTLRPILFDRYLIAIWPTLLLLAAAAATRLNRRAGPLLLATIALTLSVTPLQVTLLEKPRPEWREVAGTFLAERKDGRRIYLFRGFAAPALQFYLRDQAEVIALEDPVLPAPAADAFELWLLIAHSDKPDIAAILANVPARFSQTGSWRGFGWGESGLALLRFSARR